MYKYYNQYMKVWKLYSWTE